MQEGLTYISWLRMPSDRVGRKKSERAFETIIKVVTLWLDIV